MDAWLLLSFFRGDVLLMEGIIWTTGSVLFKSFKVGISMDGQM